MTRMRYETVRSGLPEPGEESASRLLVDSRGHGRASVYVEGVGRCWVHVDNSKVRVVRRVMHAVDSPTPCRIVG